MEELEAEVAAVYAELMARENFDFDTTSEDVIGNIINTETGSDRNDWFKTDGWTETSEGVWTKDFKAADKLPMPEVKGVKRRIVRDLVNGVLIDDSVINGRTKPERLRRSLKRRRNVVVEIEVDEISEVATKPWEELEMNPSDATMHRGVVARCNLLSIDRPDILFASKECSRCMAKPVNGDWEALKRLGRYLLSRPRVVRLFRWQNGIPVSLQRFQLGRMP